MVSRIKGVDEAIVYHAKKEFLEKGFNDASLRIIAQNAGASTSTIYTRYSDKEGLFRHLVEPAANGMREYIYNALSEFRTLTHEEQKKRHREYSDVGFPTLVEFMYAHFDEFKLLVDCSPNSFYNDFLESLVELDMACMREFLINMKSKAYIEGRITDGFLHVVSSAFYAGIFEVVKHDMPQEDAVVYVDELRKFYNSGWKAYF